MTAPTDPATAPAVPGFLVPPSAPIDLSRLSFPEPLRNSGALTILDITKFFGDATGGIRTYLLAKAAYVQGHTGLRQVLVVPGARDALAEEGGVRCYRLRGPRIPFDSSYRFLLATRTTRRIIDHERPDLIEVGSPWLVPWLTRRANRALRAPLVWFYHTHFPSIIHPHLGKVGAGRRAAGQAAWGYVRRLARIYRGVLVASESVARQLEAAGVERVHRVALGVDLDRFHPARRSRRDEIRGRYGLPNAPLAVYVGRFAGEKQIETVIAAWDEVHRRTGARLVLVGAGPREARLRAAAVGKAVHWVPYVRDREGLANLVAACDLYVAPGPAETFGLSALEAMASGLPVLSVDSGGVADRVHASCVGRVYPPFDVTECATAATGLIEDDLVGLGRRARAFAEQHHSWTTAFDGITSVYRRILGHV
ncbi:MAG TPA: glycosyltransferase [Gemmatimonadales bacterium]|nr:glycosyltransferase [Gemmatimonadales bacterium]